MILIYILIAILIILILLLFSNLNLKIIFNSELTIKIRIWFFTYKVNNQKLSNKKDTKNSKKNLELNKIFKKNKLSNIVKLILDITSIVHELSKELYYKLIIDKFHLNLLIVGDDAADTATNYGYVCSIIYPAISLIYSSIRKIKNKNINVIAGFDAAKTTANFDFKCHIKIYNLILLVFSAIKKLYKNKNIKMLIKK